MLWAVAVPIGFGVVSAVYGSAYAWKLATESWNDYKNIKVINLKYILK